MPEDLHVRVELNMTNQAPIAESVVGLFEALRIPFKAAAHTAIDLCPPGRELSLALTHLEEGLMQAVAAIARNQSAALTQNFGVEG